MKKILLVSLGLVLISLCLLWLRPRMFDDNLVFTPEPPEEWSIEVNSALVHNLFRSPDPVFDDTVLSNIYSRLESNCLSGVATGIGCVEKALQLGYTIPIEWRNKAYLRSRVASALTNEVFRLHFLIKTHTRRDVIDYFDLTASTGRRKYSDFLFKGMCIVLREFTFKKNKTLNLYWQRVAEFSANEEMNNIVIDRRLEYFKFDNFYGEMVLALAAPSVLPIMKMIERVGI